MITIDESAYPLVVITAEGELTVSDVRHFTERLEVIFDRETPCAVIWISPEHVVNNREASKLQTQWLKQHKARIGEVCRGFAWVLHSPTQLFLYKPMIALQGKRMMGCPSAAFGDIDSAKTWAAGQLAIF